MDWRKDARAIGSGVATAITTFWAITEIAKDYGVSVAMPTNYLLAVAIIALTAFPIWIGYQLYPRLHRRATHDLRKILLSLEENGEMWLLGYDHDAWTKHNPEIIKSAVKDKHVKFTFLFFYPQSRIFHHAVESALLEEGSSKTGRGSVDNLRKIKQALGEDQDKIQVKFCDLPPVCSMVIVNPTSEVAVAHLWPHMYKVLYSGRLWLTYAKNKANEKKDFEKCKASFEYANADEKSWKDGDPVPAYVELWKPESEGTIMPLKSGDLIALRSGEPVRVTVSLEPEKQILLPKGYQSLIREDLIEIHSQYQQFVDAQKIYFKYWNETNATLKRELIGKIGDTDVLYDTIEEIAKILNWWNDNVDRQHSLTYQVNNGEYLQGLDTHYKTLKTIGFLPTWFSV